MTDLASGFRLYLLRPSEIPKYFQKLFVLTKSAFSALIHDTILQGYFIRTVVTFCTEYTATKYGFYGETGKQTSASSFRQREIITQ